MSGSHRNHRYALIALGMTLLAIVFSSWFSQPVGEQKTQQGVNTAEYSQEHYGPTEGRWWPEFSARDTYAQWVMALFSIAATGVSFLAVVWVKRTLLETRRIGEAQVRAYVVIAPDDIGEPKSDGRPIVITLKVKNTGATPARNLTIQGDVRVLEFEGHDEVGKFSIDFPDVPHIDIQVGAGVEEKSDIIVDDLSGHQRRLIVEHKTHRLFLIGRVTYDDVFGNRRRTNFRAFYRKNDHYVDGGRDLPWDWQFTKTGNNAD